MILYSCDTILQLTGQLAGNGHHISHAAACINQVGGAARQCCGGFPGVSPPPS